MEAIQASYVTLQSVKTAASASHDTALPTLVDEVRKHIITLLAAVAAAARLPRCMPTLVVCHQVGPLPFHEIRPLPVGHRLSPGISVYDGVGAVKQIGLVPLLASARLPGLTAHVAELGTAAAG